MNVQVKLFAIAKQLAETDTADVVLPEQATVAQLRQALAEQYPQLAGTLDSVVFAVNTEYAGDDRPLSSKDEIACIPPVSGG